MYKEEFRILGYSDIGLKCLRHRQKDLTMVYQADIEEWTDIQKIRCRNTEECKKHRITTTGVCLICGGKYIPEEEKFIKECGNCGKQVDKLYGEIVPYLCEECYEHY
jgi:hypothetical protein